MNLFQLKIEKFSERKINLATTVCSILVIIKHLRAYIDEFIYLSLMEKSSVFLWKNNITLFSPFESEIGIWILHVQ